VKIFKLTGGILYWQQIIYIKRRNSLKESSGAQHRRF